MRIADSANNDNNVNINNDLRTVKNFFQNLPIVIYSALPDEHSTTILVTDAILDITGYTAEEFYKKPELWKEIIHDDDKDSVWNTIQRQRKDKVPLKMTYRVVTKVGDIKWLKDEAVPVFDQNSKMIRIDGFLEDITELKKIRDQIRFQSVLVQNVSDAIISMDLDFKILSWNAAAQKIYGWTEKEVIGKRLVDLVNPVYIKGTRDQVLKNFYKVGHWAGEMIQKRKDGKEIVIQSSGSYIKDISGKPIGIVTVNRDITMFKEVEKKIEDIARFPSQNPYPVLRINKNGNIIFANTSGKKFVRSWGKNYMPGLLKKSIDEALRSRKNNEVEVNQDNKTFLFSIVPILDEGYVNIYGMDITTEVKVRNAFKKNEEQYRLAQCAANVGSWDWDIISGNLEWSEIIEPLFGFKRGKFGGRYEDFLNCIHPDDRQFVVDSINDCVEKDIEYDIEHRIVWPDESVHWVRETGDVIRDDNGKAVRMLGIVQEITDRKRNEEQIKKLNESLWQYAIRLEAANKEVEAFSYSVSHDLRAPLRSIDGFSQALIEDYSNKLDETGIDYLNRVRNASQRMGQLIDGMLQLSRLSRKEMHIENVNMAELAVDIVNKFRKEDSSRNVDFKVQDDLVAKGDKNLLQILLENLLGNAWKFTSKRSKAKIEFGKTKKKKEKVFFIKDNGTGFDVKYIDKLFVPFQRLHDDEFPGDGIGLGIVSRIIRRHVGQIWAESELGKGAIFYFKLGGKKHE